ncbi:VOC family protein [Xanthovirga aplysinae]|uniref:VOC family protein n=1 Tax=Xanthovirga aplysinae TaxID=2529853 RepID=UPI0012BC0833|nr:VOC family protein [Xanthovirga aplysinae]MTI30424.1 hypothetical protein [Xanthovirga aplysinae]
MILESFTLKIFNPEKTLPFYTNVLGFKLVEEFTVNDSTFYNLELENPAHKIQLEFNKSATLTPYHQTTTDNYWKFSLFVDDIQRVYKELLKQKHPIGEPSQIGDIGYLSHTADLENHQIEFIQKTFKHNSVSVPPKKGFLLKEQPVLGLLTIRTKYPQKSIELFEDLLDLKLFVRMNVNRGNGFTLYFLGDKNLQAPSQDIDALENREWMYQQSHLFIEIQYYWVSEQDEDFSLNNTQENGLHTINFSGDLTVLKEKLALNKIPFNQLKNYITFETLDKHKILVKESHNPED